MTRRAGLGRWHAHEGRHTAVSIMSSNGVPIQEISDTVGHKSTHVTETVYRHVIVPAIRGGAPVMDVVCNDDEDDTDEGSETAENDLGSGIGSKPSNRGSETGEVFTFRADLGKRGQAGGSPTG
jgi:hypothetical protein